MALASKSLLNTVESTLEQKIDILVADMDPSPRLKCQVPTALQWEIWVHNFLAKNKLALQDLWMGETLKFPRQQHTAMSYYKCRSAFRMTIFPSETWEDVTAET